MVASSVAASAPIPDEAAVNSPRAHDVRTASSSTSVRSTDVSASIASSRADARSAASPARARAGVGAEPRGVPVAVEDVVDDLEEQAQLLAERTPRSLRGGGTSAAQRPSPTAAGEQPAGLEPVQLGEVDVGAA